MSLTCRKVKDAQPMGQYVPTGLDAQKAAADFRLLQVSPNVIAWKNGDTQRVSDKQLAALQLAHSWVTDF